MPATHPKGYSAIITILFMIALFLIIIGSIVTVAITDLHIATNSIRGVRAFHVAESGVERLIADWIHLPHPDEGVIYNEEPLVDVDGTLMGTYTVTATAVDESRFFVESVGKSQNAHRKIESEIEVRLGGVDPSFSKSLMTTMLTTLPSNMRIWGDVYFGQAFQEPWNNGAVFATDGQGRQFASEPTADEAPFGRVEYYHSEEDAWVITPAPTATNNGDAHGYYQSSQNIHRSSTWLNPLHNIGNPDIPGSGQYYNRDNRGNEDLDGTTAEQYDLKTGIALRNSDQPLPFPDIDNGTRASFVAYYNERMPDTIKRSSLAIEDLERGGTIALGNGRNDTVIGAAANPAGFPTQFLWEGTAVRDDGSTYRGDLALHNADILYADGDIDMSDGIAMPALTLISSGETNIENVNPYPDSHFSILAFGDIILSEEGEIRGVLFTSGTLDYYSSARFQGAIIAQTSNFRNGGIDLIYDERQIFQDQPYLPGATQTSIHVLNWKEVAP